MQADFQVHLRKKCDHGFYLNEGKVKDLPECFKETSVKTTVEATVKAILGCALKGHRKKLETNLSTINFKGIDRVSKGKEALVGLKKELQCCNNFLGNRPPKRQFCQKCKVKQSGTSGSPSGPVPEEASSSTPITEKNTIDENNTTTSTDSKARKHSVKIYFRKNCRAGGLLDPEKVFELPSYLKSINIPLLSKLILETIVKCAYNTEQVFKLVPYGGGSIVVEAKIGEFIQRKSFPFTHSKTTLKKLLKQFSDAIGMCPNFVTLQAPSKTRCKVCKVVKPVPSMKEQEGEDDARDRRDGAPPAKKRRLTDQSIVCREFKVVIERLPKDVVKRYLQPVTTKKDAYFRGQKITVIIPESKYQRSPEKVLFTGMKRIPSMTDGVDCEAENPLNDFQNIQIKHEDDPSSYPFHSVNSDHDSFLGDFIGSPRKQRGDRNVNGLETIVDGPLSVLFEKDNNVLGLPSGLVNDNEFSENAEECERSLTMRSPKSYFGGIDLMESLGDQAKNAGIDSSGVVQKSVATTSIEREIEEDSSTAVSKESGSHSSKKVFDQNANKDDFINKLVKVEKATDLFISNGLATSNAGRTSTQTISPRSPSNSSIELVPNNQSTDKGKSSPAFANCNSVSQPNNLSQSSVSSCVESCTDNILTSTVAPSNQHEKVSKQNTLLNHLSQYELTSNDKQLSHTSRQVSGIQDQSYFYSGIGDIHPITRNPEIPVSTPGITGNLPTQLSGNRSEQIQGVVPRHSPGHLQSQSLESMPVQSPGQLPLAVPGTPIIVPPPNAMYNLSANRSITSSLSPTNQAMTWHDFPGTIAGQAPHQYPTKLPYTVSRLGNVGRYIERPPMPFTTASPPGYATNNMYTTQGFPSPRINSGRLDNNLGSSSTSAAYAHQYNPRLSTPLHHHWPNARYQPYPAHYAGQQVRTPQSLEDLQRLTSRMNNMRRQMPRDSQLNRNFPELMAMENLSRQPHLSTDLRTAKQNKSETLRRNSVEIDNTSDKRPAKRSLADGPQQSSKRANNTPSLTNASNNGAQVNSSNHATQMYPGNTYNTFQYAKQIPRFHPPVPQPSRYPDSGLLNKSSVPQQFDCHVGLKQLPNTSRPVNVVTPQQTCDVNPTDPAYCLEKTSFGSHSSEETSIRQPLNSLQQVSQPREGQSKIGSPKSSPLLNSVSSLEKTNQGQVSSQTTSSPSCVTKATTVSASSSSESTTQTSEAMQSQRQASSQAPSSPSCVAKASTLSASSPPKSTSQTSETVQSQRQASSQAPSSPSRVAATLSSSSPPKSTGETSEAVQSQRQVCSQAPNSPSRVGKTSTLSASSPSESTTQTSEAVLSQRQASCQAPNSPSRVTKTATLSASSPPKSTSQTSEVVQSQIQTSSQAPSSPSCVTKTATLPASSPPKSTSQTSEAVQISNRETQHSKRSVLYATQEASNTTVKPPSSVSDSSIDDQPSAVGQQNSKTMHQSKSIANTTQQSSGALTKPVQNETKPDNPAASVSSQPVRKKSRFARKTMVQFKPKSTSPKQDIVKSLTPFSTKSNNATLPKQLASQELSTASTQATRKDDVSDTAPVSASTNVSKEKSPLRMTLRRTQKIGNSTTCSASALENVAASGCSSKDSTSSKSDGINLRPTTHKTSTTDIRVARKSANSVQLKTSTSSESSIQPMQVTTKSNSAVPDQSHTEKVHSVTMHESSRFARKSTSSVHVKTATSSESSIQPVQVTTKSNSSVHSKKSTISNSAVPDQSHTANIHSATMHETSRVARKSTNSVHSKTSTSPESSIKPAQVTATSNSSVDTKTLSPSESLILNLSHTDKLHTATNDKTTSSTSTKTLLSTAEPQNIISVEPPAVSNRSNSSSSVSAKAPPSTAGLQQIISLEPTTVSIPSNSSSSVSAKAPTSSDSSAPHNATPSILSSVPTKSSSANKSNLQALLRVLQECEPIRKENVKKLLVLLLKKLKTNAVIASYEITNLKITVGPVVAKGECFKKILEILENAPKSACEAKQSPKRPLQQIPLIDLALPSRAKSSENLPLNQVPSIAISQQTENTNANTPNLTGSVLPMETLKSSKKSSCSSISISDTSSNRAPSIAISQQTDNTNANRPKLTGSVLPIEILQSSKKSSHSSISTSERSDKDFLETTTTSATRNSPIDSIYSKNVFNVSTPNRSSSKTQGIDYSINTVTTATTDAANNSLSPVASPKSVSSGNTAEQRHSKTLTNGVSGCDKNGTVSSQLVSGDDIPSKVLPKAVTSLKSVSASDISDGTPLSSNGSINGSSSTSVENSSLTSTTGSSSDLQSGAVLLNTLPRTSNSDKPSLQATATEATRNKDCNPAAPTAIKDIQALRNINPYKESASRALKSLELEVKATTDLMVSLSTGTSEETSVIPQSEDPLQNPPNIAAKDSEISQVELLDEGYQPTTETMITSETGSGDGQNSITSASKNQATANPTANTTIPSNSEEGASISRLSSQNAFYLRFLKKLRENSKQDQRRINIILKSILNKLRTKGAVSVLDLVKLQSSASEDFRKTNEFRMLMSMFKTNATSSGRQSSNEVVDLTSEESDMDTDSSENNNSLADILGMVKSEPMDTSSQIAKEDLPPAISTSPASMMSVSVKKRQTETTTETPLMDKQPVASISNLEKTPIVNDSTFVPLTSMSETSESSSSCPIIVSAMSLNSNAMTTLGASQSAVVWSAVNSPGMFGSTVNNKTQNMLPTTQPEVSAPAVIVSAISTISNKTQNMFPQSGVPGPAFAQSAPTLLTTIPNSFAPKQSSMNGPISVQSAVTSINPDMLSRTRPAVIGSAVTTQPNMFTVNANRPNMFYPTFRPAVVASAGTLNRPNMLSSTQPGINAPAVIQSAVTHNIPNMLSSAQPEINGPAVMQSAVTRRKPNILSSAKPKIDAPVVIQSAVTASRPNTLSSAQPAINAPAVIQSAVTPSRPNALSSIQPGINGPAVIQSAVTASRQNTLSSAQPAINAPAGIESAITPPRSAMLNNNLSKSAPYLPKPIVTVSAVDKVTILMWDLPDKTMVNSIASYEIFAIQLNNNEHITQDIVFSKTWTPLGVVNSLTPPMAITLTNLFVGLKSYIIIRAVDHRGKTGPFSSICEVKAISK